MERSGQSEMSRIADLLARARAGDAWHGPSLGSLLVGVTASQATAHPVAGAHSIRELVRHIAVWERVVARRLRGVHAEPAPDEDWPRVPDRTDDDGWRADMLELDRARVELTESLLAFDERRLGDVVPGKSYSYYVIAHGAVQHDLYHAGQIALLRKGSR